MGAVLPESGSRGLQRLFTFRVVIAGDSVYSQQIVFCELMGLSCSNLGSDSFAFIWKVRSVQIEWLASSGVSVCLIFVFVFVALCVCTYSGTWVRVWQQVLNLPEHTVWNLLRPVLMSRAQRSTHGQRSISDSLTCTRLSEIDFASWLKSICSQADVFASWVGLAHTNILGQCLTVEC